MYKGVVLKAVKIDKIETLINKVKKIIIVIFLSNY